jgi:hypothetical protein
VVLLLRHGKLRQASRTKAWGQNMRGKKVSVRRREQVISDAGTVAVAAAAAAAAAAAFAAVMPNG